MKDEINLILDAKEVDIVIDALDCYAYMAYSLSEANKYIEINTIRNHIYEKIQKEFDNVEERTIQ